MKIAVLLIDESYVVPPGTLHLGTSGWVFDRPEMLKIRINIPLGMFLEKLAQEHSGLLGEGELVFATLDDKGNQFGPGLWEYLGRILFSPEE